MGYFVLSRGKPAVLPVQPLPTPALADVQERIAQFKSEAPAPLPVATSTPDEPGPTPTATAAEPSPSRELRLTASEINGLIAANRKARGHASVSLSGNTATVQVSIGGAEVPGLPMGYLNGAFSITTDGPTPISALQVSKVQANGMPVPSGVLSMSYRGRSLMGYALEGLAPYHVSTAEIRDGVLYAR